MAIDPDLRLDILGAGPAGLGVGYYAKKKGIPFSIYEYSNLVGGNCKTIHKGEFAYDTGAHRFHDKDHSITSDIKSLLGDDLLEINAPSQIYHKRGFMDFPLNVNNLIKNLNKRELINIGYENFSNIFKLRGNPKDFKELAYKKYGKTISDLFLINYTEKLWGRNASTLDPKISGSRLKNLDLKSIVQPIFFKKSNPLHLDGSFFYPKNGFGTIFEKIYERVGYENVFLNSKITKLKHDGKIMKEVEYNGKNSVKVGNVINTLPINKLANILDPAPPKNIMNILNQIEFRDVRLCILFLNLPRFSKNASIYFPHSNIPFNRIYEPKNRSYAMAPKNKTCIVIEKSCSREKLIDSDEDFFLKVKFSLIKNRFINEEDIFDYSLGYIPNAYPILSVDISEKLKTVKSYFNSFENHLLHGRNAEFKYVHTHNILKKSKLIIDSIISGNN